MVRDRIGNNLKQAKRVTLSPTGQPFKDFVGNSDQNDLYVFSLGGRNSFDFQLSGVGKKADVNVELFTLKGSKSTVFRRVGKTDFSNFRASDIKRNLIRVASSKNKGRNNEFLDLTLGSGEYYLRVYQQKGDTQYNLTLSATLQVPALTPTPTPTPTPLPFALSWIRQLGTAGNDYAYGTTTDGSGNVYFVGTTNASGSSLGDSFVAEYDSSGTQLWQRTLDLPGSDIAFDIAVDSTGNYYIAGAANIVTSGLNAGIDGYVAKYDSNGTLLWSKFIQTSVSLAFFTVAALDAASSLTLDNSDNVYVSGFVKAIPPIGGPLSNPSQAFISKFSGATGELVTNFGSGGRLEFGTSGSTAVADVAVDSSGDIYVTGVTGATLTTDINNPFTEGDAFVAKFRGNNGNSLWSQMLASSGQDYARSIAVFGSDVYITGDTTGTLAGQTSFGDYDGFVARYTQNGNGTASTQDWVKQFGTASLDQSQSITVDTNGFVGVGKLEDELGRID